VVAVLVVTRSVGRFVDPHGSNHSVIFESLELAN